MKEEILVSKLIELNYTIASAESCTGGMFASTIINVANASKVINSSVVTYSNEAKEQFCNVKRETILKFGVVSEEVAEEMSVGISTLCKSNIGVSFTGYAGPSTSIDDEVGKVCFGFYINGSIYTYCKIFNGDRNSIRCDCVQFAIDKLLELLEL